MSVQNMVARHLAQGGRIETDRPFAKTSEGIPVSAYRDHIVNAQGIRIATLPASFRLAK